MVASGVLKAWARPSRTAERRRSPWREASARFRRFQEGSFAFESDGGEGGDGVRAAGVDARVGSADQAERAERAGAEGERAGKFAGLGIFLWLIAEAGVADVVFGNWQGAGYVELGGLGVPDGDGGGFEDVGDEAGELGPDGLAAVDEEEFAAHGIEACGVGLMFGGSDSLMAQAAGEQADDEDYGFKGAERDGVLRVGHIEGEDGLGEVVVEAGDGEERGEGSFEESPLEGDGKDEQEVEEAGDKGFGDLKGERDPGNERDHAECGCGSGGTLDGVVGEHDV